MSFTRAELERGFEPVPASTSRTRSVRGKPRVDPSVDLPPDLIVEIDITSPSLNKLPVYAQMGVPEIWRYDGERLVIFKRESTEYVGSAESTTLA